MIKKTAFSLTELMIVLLIASLIVAASIPVLTKKHFKMPSLLGHGVYLCFYDNNGQLKQLQSNNQFANPNDAVTVKDCIFTPPQKASYFQISAKGGGGGGGDSGYTGGHPYSGWSPIQEFSPMGITEEYLNEKKIKYSEFQDYAGKLHVYALGRAAGNPGSVMVVNTVERCVLLPEPQCKETKTYTLSLTNQCVVPEGTEGATKHEMIVGQEPVRVSLESPYAVYTTGSVKYSNCKTQYACLNYKTKEVQACGCQDQDENISNMQEMNPSCILTNEICKSLVNNNAYVVENLTMTVNTNECNSPKPPNAGSNPDDWQASTPQNSTNCDVDGTYEDRIFVTEQWELQDKVVEYYTIDCPGTTGTYNYTYCRDWDMTNIGKTPENPTDTTNCGDIGTFYYNKAANTWNNGTGQKWEAEDFLYDYPIKGETNTYVRNTNRFSTSIAYFCTTSQDKDGNDLKGDVNLNFRSPSFEVNPKGPYLYSSPPSTLDYIDVSSTYKNKGYNTGNIPYRRLVEKKDGTYYYNKHLYYDNYISEKYDDIILNMIATYKVSPLQGKYGNTYCLSNEYQKENALNPTWLEGCGIDNRDNSKCKLTSNEPNTITDNGRNNTVKKYGEVLGCGQTGTSEAPSSYSVNKKKWLYSDAMILKGSEIVAHIKAYSAWKGQPGLLRLLDKKRTVEYQSKYPGSTPFEITGIYSNAYQGKYNIEVALEGLKIDNTLFNRVQNALQAQGIYVESISYLVDKIGLYKWNDGEYRIDEDQIYDSNGDFTEKYKDYLAQGKTGLGWTSNTNHDPTPTTIIDEIYNQESLKKPWSGRGLCENGLRENDDNAVTKYSKSNGLYWCRMYSYLGSTNDVFYHLANDEITNSRGYCLEHSINPNGSGYNRTGENAKAQINNTDYYMQPNELAQYRYRYSFDQNFLQYGNPGAAGEYKSMVIRSLKDMDTTIRIGRGGQAGNYMSGDSGTDGSATSMGSVIVAEGGKGGEGGLIAKAEVLPAYDKTQYWQEWLCKNKKDGEFSPPTQDDDMYDEYQSWKNSDQYALPDCATMTEWKHVVTSGLIEGGIPALRGLAANLYNFVIPQLKDKITEKFDEFGNGGRGGGVEHSCWVGQNIIQFEYYNLSTSTCPYSGYFIDADGTRKKCSDNIKTGYSTLPCDPNDKKNYKVFGGEDGKDGALMIRW